MDNTCNITISLIKSNVVSESMRSGYMEFLHRYINHPNSIHDEEITLVKQEAKKLKIETHSYNEEQLHEVLKLYQNIKNRNTYSYSKNTEQNSHRVNTNNNSETSEIEKLNGIIKDLKQKGKQAVASRDEWKRRAEIAESKQNEHFSNYDRKFKQVKKMFSKMYHPDSITGDKFEKLVKQEIFKEFWQIIEEIDKSIT